jgi:hypothetical protein
MEVPPADALLVCGLVWAKLIAHVEEEGLILVSFKFFPSALLSTYATVHPYSLLASLT